MTNTGELMGSIAQTVETLQQAAQTCVDVKQELEDTYGGLKNTADQALSKADAALPKSGGEMTGNLWLDKALKFKMLDMKYNELPTTTQVSSIEVRDADSHNLSNFVTQLSASGNRNILLRLFKHGEDTIANCAEMGLQYMANSDSFHGFCPHPDANAYGKEIATMKALKDYAMRRSPDAIDVYIDTVNGSDTAGLFQNRGFSEDMPFASLGAAIAFVKASYVNASNVRYNLLSDASLNANSNQNMSGGMNSIIQSPAGKPKRTLTVSNVNILAGCMTLRDVNVQISAGSGYMCKVFCKYGQGTLVFAEGVSLSGQVSSATVIAEQCGRVFVQADIGGSVTGKRYSAATGGVIITNGRGANAIPGTIDGTTDSISFYL